MIADQKGSPAADNTLHFGEKRLIRILSNVK